MAGMESSYPGKLSDWAALASVALQDRASPEASEPADVANQLFVREALHPLPRLHQGDGVPEPYTLQWFLHIESVRHSRDGRWIPRLLEFGKHSGETLLGLGDGLGTDWVQYARHGASVIACSPSAHQLSLIRRNFELRGLTGRYLHAVPESLPLENASIDVVCLTGLLQELEAPQPLVEEVYRVLKPGGKVLAVAPARYDVDFWRRLGSPLWLTRRRPEEPAVVRYSARELRHLFGHFVEQRVHKRQLRRSHVPHVCRWLPRSVLERLMGRVLVLKAFKPLSAAMAVPLAA